MPKLLQIANVGSITGGTGACAWTITRALPDWQHEVWFRTEINSETRTTFSQVPIYSHPRVYSKQIDASHPNIVILHNTSRTALPHTPCIPTLQYVHSLGTPAPADRTVYCSHYLDNEYCHQNGSVANNGPGRVLWQGVPRPIRPANCRKRRGNRLVVGRLCTPTIAKFPPALVPFYEQLARRHSLVDWEFVGCPTSLKQSLANACQGRVVFHDAGWHARQHLWNWDAMLYHHPTITESFGRTAAEAMRAGCIPIVDARGGFIEQLAGVGAGQEFKLLASSFEVFSQALQELQDRSACNELSVALSQHADREFSLQRFRERLSAHLAATISQHSDRARVIHDARANFQ